MFPGPFGGCGGPGLGLWPGSLRGGGWAGSDFGFPECRGGSCGVPANFGCGCGVPSGCNFGCGVPSGCGFGCGTPFGFGFNAQNFGCGTPFGFGCGTPFGCGSDCGCCSGYRWCECEACNPLGGFGDGPCGGYVSFRDRFGFGCGC